MPIRFPCTACGQLLGIATRKVGTEINCPTCGLAVIVPDEEQAKLLRQRYRSERKQAASFATPDTPPEISIPRESSEAFDGGLESFLTQLEIAPTSSSPQTINVSAGVKTPAPKSAPSTAPAATIAAVPTTASKPVNGTNGTHAPPVRQVRPAGAVAAPAAKSPAPPIASATTSTLPTSVGLLEELPLAFEDHEVSVLSEADLLEVAEEPLSQPTLAPRAKVPVPPSSTVAKPAVVKPTVLVPSKPAAVPVKPPQAQPAPPMAKPAPVPLPVPAAEPVPAPNLDIAPLIEITAPAVSDFGFDFSSSPAAAVPARKAEPAPVVSIAPHTTPVAPPENAVWISRHVIYTHVAILVLVSIATFLVGWISGGAGARIPGVSNAGPVRFEAQIQYLANGKTLPDEGAVVLLWPKQAKPLERLSSKRLSPSEPAPPPDLPALKAIETLHGAYARANTQGEVRDLVLTEPGEYYVLVISRNLARPPMEPISDKVIPILGDLFGGDAVTLLGNRQFTLKSYMIADTRTLNHTFGVPAEAK